MYGFLAYVCVRLLGRPIGVGTPCWRCPECEHPRHSLVVNEPKAGCADKWRCHRCDAWGDEYDLLRLVAPEVGRYPARRLVVAALRADWEAEQAGRPPTADLSSGNGAAGQLLLPMGT